MKAHEYDGPDMMFYTFNFMEFWSYGWSHNILSCAMQPRVCITDVRIWTQIRIQIRIQGFLSWTRIRIQTYKTWIRIRNREKGCA